MSPCSKEINILVVDEEGVGRNNLGKAVLMKKLPDIPINSAGIHKPESGRTDIHPSVIEVAKNRYGVDISDWPVQLLSPEMINNQTLVLVLCNPELVPDYVLENAYDVLLAPIEDPFGLDIE